MERKILETTLNCEIAGEVDEALPRPKVLTPCTKALSREEGHCYETGPCGVMVQIASGVSIFSTKDSLRVKLQCAASGPK